MTALFRKLLFSYFVKAEKVETAALSYEETMAPPVSKRSKSGRPMTPTH